MPLTGEDEQEIDQALQVWRQGDVSLDTDLEFLHFADLSRPHSPASVQVTDALAADGEAIEAGATAVLGRSAWCGDAQPDLRYRSRLPRPAIRRGCAPGRGGRALVRSVPIRLSPTPTICMVWRQVAREADEAGMDVLQRQAFPRSLPEFQRLFPDDTASADLEKARWGDGLSADLDGGGAVPHHRPKRRLALPEVPPRHQADGADGLERTHTPLGV